MLKVLRFLFCCGTLINVVNMNEVRSGKKTRSFAFVKIRYERNYSPMAGKKGGSTVDVVWKLAQPIIEKLDLILWDVRFVKEGANWFLRIFIDSENGVTIEDCEAVSRAIDEPLDELDPIDQNYCLEVCSPGLERELARPEHFERFLGEEVMVKMIRPLDPVGKEFLAKLIKSGKTEVTLLTENAGEVDIKKKDMVWIKLNDFEL